MTDRPRVLLVHGLWSSARTWWRVGPALTARGWEVEEATLAGHGSRPLGTIRSVADLATDLVSRHPGDRTLVVGHSFGAVVALQLAATLPTYALGVLLEDPPGRGRVRPAEERGDEGEGAGSREDPDAVMASLLAGHPTWSRRDARSVVEGRLLTDPVMADLPPRALSWDLSQLVATCPVPVGLLAAIGRYSALADPDRSAVVRQLPPERVTEVAASHHVHLDEPARWVDAVDTFGRSLLS